MNDPIVLQWPHQTELTTAPDGSNQLTHTGQEFVPVRGGGWARRQKSTDVRCIISAKMERDPTSTGPVSGIRICFKPVVNGVCVGDPQCLTIDEFDATEDQAGLPENVIIELMKQLKAFCAQPCAYVPPKNFQDINVSETLPL
jgi:hypothetical protein